MRVRICNAEADEAQRLGAALGPGYDVDVRTAWEPAVADLSGVDAVVLDANFTENHGFELLMEHGAQRRVPVLLVTPPEEPQIAIEARRLGVFHYVVKTPKLPEILRVALAETTNLFADAAENRKLIQALRSRVSELETKISGRAMPAVERARLGKRKKLFELLMERVGKGEVQIPALPDVPGKLRDLLRGDPEIGDVAKLIQQDAAISARIIGVSNSAYYASFKTNHTVAEAVSTLGLNATWRHVELAANRNLYTLRNNRYRSLLKPLWQHAAATAELSRAIALQTQTLEPDLAFTVGLLHDVGHLFLIQLVADLDAEGALDETPTEAGMAAFLAEHHGAFGAKLLELWKLPPIYANVARLHEPEQPEGENAEAAHIVKCADLLAARLGFGDRGGPPLDADIARVATAMNLAPDKLGEAEREVAKLLGAL